MRRYLNASWFVLVWLTWPAAASTDAPGWMRDAATSKTPAYGEKVAGVVLLDERIVKVEDDGRIITNTRYVVRILTREGRGHAAASQVYLPGTGKVREMRAWMIHPSGEVKQYEKDYVVDAAVGGFSEYNEVRHKLERIRPTTLGQAARIEGMTPAALTLVLAHVKGGQRAKARA